MTPFSSKLRMLRESRGIRQNLLAQDIGVSSSYLSALEKGKKAPPHNCAFYERLQFHLELSGSELDELKELAAATEDLGPFTNAASMLHVEVAMTFAKLFNDIPRSHLQAIKALLDSIEPSKVSATNHRVRK